MSFTFLAHLARRLDGGISPTTHTFNVKCSWSAIECSLSKFCKRFDESSFKLELNESRNIITGTVKCSMLFWKFCKLLFDGAHTGLKPFLLGGLSVVFKRFILKELADALTHFSKSLIECRLFKNTSSLKGPNNISTNSVFYRQNAMKVRADWERNLEHDIKAPWVALEQYAKPASIHFYVTIPYYVERFWSSFHYQRRCANLGGVPWFWESLDQWSCFPASI